MTFVPLPDARPNDAAWPRLSWPPAKRLTGNIVELSLCVPHRDAAPLFEVLNHDEVWSHVSGRPNSAQQYASTLNERLTKGRWVWIVRLLQPVALLPVGAVVGTTSFLDASIDDAWLEIGATAYAPSVWGTRVNADSKLQLLSCAFEALGAGRVQLKTDVRNGRSQRAISRLGAQYEGTLRRHKRRSDGTIRDSALFSITAEDWPAVKASLFERVK
jgi:N-acetyltransferase